MRMLYIDWDRECVWTEGTVIFNNVHKSVAQGVKPVSTLWSLGMKQSWIRLQLRKKGADFQKSRAGGLLLLLSVSLTRLFYKHLNMLGT